MTTATHHPTPASADKGHFHDLDGVRGLLAIVVMLYHYGLNSIVGALIGIDTAVFDVCVDFFFILSGLVIARSVMRAAINVRTFIARRFFRLFPLHIAISVLFAPVLFVGTDIVAGEMLLNLTAFGPFVLQELQNFPAWSLGFEFYGPIVFVALLSLKLPNRRQAFALGGILLVCSTFALHQTLTGQNRLFGPYLDYMRALSGLGLGFMLWLVFQDGWRPLPDNISRIVFPLSIGLFFVVTIGSAAFSPLAWTMSFVLVVAMATGMGSRTVFSSKPFRFAGRLSFGIYMVHVPVMLVFQHVFGPAVQSGNVTLKLAMIICSCIAACGLYWFVERPSLGLIQLGSR